MIQETKSGLWVSTSNGSTSERSLNSITDQYHLPCSLAIFNSVNKSIFLVLEYNSLTTLSIEIWCNGMLRPSLLLICTKRQSITLTICEIKQSISISKLMRALQTSCLLLWKFSYVDFVRLRFTKCFLQEYILNSTLSSTRCASYKLDKIILLLLTHKYTER